MVSAGIGGSALAWIESYLSERSSQVAWAGDTPLTPTPCARNLGVVMDNRLSLSENIAVVLSAWDSTPSPILYWQNSKIDCD
ncbi:hypothetical protein SKAU_G00161960 [Synaphobranchus kaupii]|uniref:Uncharacterized protein n=1 Tax=Synaphobranchus kaupii TaxID=118154 RepID=A0A9Q1IYZ5_SYNKA|nr:hypothetical protein SKAU_G00161960 [Synaphobranchus kaupii]